MSKQNRREERRKRPLDQVILALALWMIPVSLFMYVGWSIALATGLNPLAYFPDLDLWQIALAVALVVGILSVLVSLRWSATRNRPGARGQWDSYSAPFSSKN